MLKVRVLVAHLCPTLYNPIDWGLPGSSAHGILQARILEWVAIHFSRGLSINEMRWKEFSNLEIVNFKNKFEVLLILITQYSFFWIQIASVLKGTLDVLKT